MWAHGSRPTHVAPRVAVALAAAMTCGENAGSASARRRVVPRRARTGPRAGEVAGTGARVHVVVSHPPTRSAAELRAARAPSGWRVRGDVASQPRAAVSASRSCTARVPSRITRSAQIMTRSPRLVSPGYRGAAYGVAAGETSVSSIAPAGALISPALPPILLSAFPDIPLWAAAPAEPLPHLHQWLCFWHCRSPP